MATPNEISTPPFKQGFASVSSDVKLCYYTNIDAISASSGRPILLLLHGYPQSSYIWRYLAPILSEAGYPVFVFDLPGYAHSRAPTLPQDKLSTGNALLTGLSSLLPPSSTPYPLIILGHDRGARIAHRLAVSFSPSLFPSFSLLGVSLMDIVPTSVQFAAFSATHQVTGYWHWAFLANAELAAQVIAAFGGRRWVEAMMQRIAGKGGKGAESLFAGDAVGVYGGHFEREEVVGATCRDYKAAAEVDGPAQEEDMKAGRKIGVPVLLVFSEVGLGSRFDIPRVWREWVREGVKVDALAVGDGCGHYVVEEAPEEVGGRVLEWLKEL